MKYHILCKDEIIASFKNETERDVCLKALTEYYATGILSDWGQPVFEPQEEK